MRPPVLRYSFLVVSDPHEPEASSLPSAIARAPSIPRNEYGLEVVDNRDLYLETVFADLRKGLVDLEEIPGLRLDLRYATTDNVMNERLYPVAKALLREPAARALGEALEELASRKLGLKVFDAYRPYGVTKKMWEPLKDPRYVADPAEGSRHNRGCAVDLTLVNSEGVELPMPTPFDEFTRRAWHDYEDLPEEIQHNRAFLREVMERSGFAALETEWWHYDYRGWEQFELLDLPLTEVP